MSAVKDSKKYVGFDHVTETSIAFKILSDPTRLKILCLLFENRDGMCVYEIAESVGISQSAASHQLSKLETRNVVDSYRDGQMVCYVLRKSEFTKNLERVMVIFKNR